MLTPHPELSTCQPGLALSPMPVWVLDAESIAVHWANSAALELWNASDLADLCARDIVTGAPEMIMARTRNVISQVQTGKVLREEWILYPRGKATTLLLDLRAVTMADGRLGLLNQAVPVGDQISATLQRSIAIYRQSAVANALVAKDGRIISQNPAATAVFGELDSWLEWFPDTIAAKAFLANALADEAKSTLMRTTARGRMLWHMLEGHTVRDPVTNEIGVLIEHIDTTARIEAEQVARARSEDIDELKAALELVDQQRREIVELSAPMLDIGERTLALPIVGRFDRDQAEVIIAKLLDAVAARGIRDVILDLTGVAQVDEGSAGRLHGLVSALRLLGARPMLTGIRPALALQLTEVGLDLGPLAIARSLADGLRRGRHS